MGSVLQATYILSMEPQSRPYRSLMRFYEAEARYSASGSGADVGLGIEDPVWVPTVFSKNRDRLLEADVAKQFLNQLLAHQEVSPLLSDEHFCVDVPRRPALRPH